MILNPKLSLKKITIVIFCVLGAILFLKKDKVEKYFKEERYYKILVKLHLLKKCYNPSYDFEDIFAQEDLNYQVLNHNVINDSLVKLANKDSKQISVIPKITHKVYFTSKNNINLAEFYLEEMQINYTKMNNLCDWQHNIWTNEQTIIPDSIRNIKGVKVRYFEEFNDHALYQVLNDLVQQGQEKKPYLAQAADLIRLMVIQKFGGIYSDMDYEIYNPKVLLDLINKYDFIGGREHFGTNSYYGNAFIAAKPNHPILNEAISMSIRNYSNNAFLPDYIKYSCSGHEALYFNGPPLVTISYLRKNNVDGNTDIILPSWMIYNVSFIRYKNQTCDIKNITSSFLQEKNLAQEKILAEFLADPQIIEAHKQDLLINEKLFDNIFYSLKYYNLYPIIGADMFCGSWTESINTIFKKNYYWNIPQ